MARFLKAVEFTQRISVSYSAQTELVRDNILTFLEKIESDCEQYLTSYRGLYTNLSFLMRYFSSSETAAINIPASTAFFQLPKNNELSLSVSNITTATPTSTITWQPEELGFTIFFRSGATPSAPSIITINSATRYPKTAFLNGKVAKLSFRSKSTSAGTSTFSFNILGYNAAGVLVNTVSSNSATNVLTLDNTTSEVATATFPASWFSGVHSSITNFSIQIIINLPFLSSIDRTINFSDLILHLDTAFDYIPDLLREYCYYWAARLYNSANGFDINQTYTLDPYVQAGLQQFFTAASPPTPVTYRAYRYSGPNT